MGRSGYGMNNLYGRLLWVTAGILNQAYNLILVEGADAGKY